MKKWVCVLMAALVACSVACGPSGKPPEETMAGVTLAAKPVELAKGAAEYLELVSATKAGEETNSFAVEAIFKAKKSIEASEIWIYYDIEARGAEKKALVTGIFANVQGPVDEGQTLEVFLNIGREGAPGERVAVVHTVSDKMINP